MFFCLQHKVYWVLNTVYDMQSVTHSVQLSTGGQVIGMHLDSQLTTLHRIMQHIEGSFKSLDHRITLVNTCHSQIVCT